MASTNRLGGPAHRRRRCRAYRWPPTHPIVYYCHDNVNDDNNNRLTKSIGIGCVAAIGFGDGDLESACKNIGNKQSNVALDTK